MGEHLQLIVNYFDRARLQLLETLRGPLSVPTRTHVQGAAYLHELAQWLVQSVNQATE
jgi:hypothetical protein